MMKTELKVGDHVRCVTITSLGVRVPALEKHEGIITKIEEECYAVNWGHIWTESDLEQWHFAHELEIVYLAIVD